MTADSPSLALPESAGRPLGWQAWVVQGFGFLLLAAAALKGHALICGLPPEPVPGIDPWAAAATLVTIEATLGTWFVLSPGGRRTWALSITVAVVLLTVAAGKLVAGKDTCGCFGAVRVPPWVTVGIDLGFLTALVAARPQAAGRRARHGFALGATMLVALGSPALLLGLARAPAPAAPAGVHEYDAFVVLEPQKWTGAAFPLLDWIETEADLAAGKWVIVFYRRDCGECTAALPELTRQAAEAASGPGGERWCFVEVPASTPGGPDPLQKSGPWVRGELPKGKKWVVKTPTQIHLGDGVVE